MYNPATSGSEQQGPQSVAAPSFQGAGLENFTNKHCEPCEGGVCPLDGDTSSSYLDGVPGWSLSADGKSISRKLKFKGFLETISFINALAYLSEQQGHHPDFCAGYGYCEVLYTTHAIGGLSENDFICAAKVNQLLDA